MPDRININGVITPPEDARVPVLDHGFLFGDSVYETLRTYGKNLFLFSRHFARLERSAASVDLRLPWDREKTLQELLQTVDAANNPANSRIRVVVSRGVGELSADPGPCKDPMIVIIVTPLSELPAEIYRDGVDIIVSSFHRNLQFANVKSGNLMLQVLASREARAARAFEAVLLTPGGKISDGITSNIYLVKNGGLLTPGIGAGILEGITRGIILDLAREAGVTVIEGLLDASEIETADEMFLTSTTRGVVPITKVNGKAVGIGKPGALTLRLLEAHRQAVKRLIQDE
jgi:branched-chain amino acid aminotransferase